MNECVHHHGAENNIYHGSIQHRALLDIEPASLLDIAPRMLGTEHGSMRQAPLDIASDRHQKRINCNCNSKLKFILS